MNNFSRISTIPEVRSAVLGDLSGVFIDAVNHPDGEAIAAVMGFAASQLWSVGEVLGLGPLRRISLMGEAAVCVVTLESTAVVAAFLDPAKSVAAVEKKLEVLLRG